MTTTNTIVANAIAVHRAANPISRNAVTVEEQRKALADLPKFKAFVDKTIAEHKAVIDVIESCIAPSKALQQKIEEVKSKIDKVKKDGQQVIRNIPDSLFQAQDLPDVKKEIRRYYECFHYDGPIYESRNKLRKILNDMWNAL